MKYDVVKTIDVGLGQLVTFVVDWSLKTPTNYIENELTFTALIPRDISTYKLDKISDVSNRITKIKDQRVSVVDELKLVQQKNIVMTKVIRKYLDGKEKS